MRVLVTGATNAFGQAIVKELAAAGHKVRAFGVEVDDDRFADVENVKSFPGWIEVAGSVEPVLAERQALVHAACLDPVPSGKDGKRKAATKIEKGTLYAVYAAEREQVDHFVHLTPAAPDKTWVDLQAAAAETAEGLRGMVNVRVVEAREPEDTARAARSILEGLPELGAVTGGNDNAVTE